MKGIKSFFFIANHPFLLFSFLFFFYFVIFTSVFSNRPRSKKFSTRVLPPLFIFFFSSFLASIIYRNEDRQCFFFFFLRLFLTWYDNNYYNALSIFHFAIVSILFNACGSFCCVCNNINVYRE